MSETFRPKNTGDAGNGVDARFLRLPSIAERKLGRDYTAPIRLDPRVLDQMQQTIRELASRYAETLSAHISQVRR